MPKTYYRLLAVLVVIVAAALLLAAAPAGSAGASPLQQATPTPTCDPGYDWTPWGGCRPRSVDCPSDTIGNQDGGARADSAENCKGLTNVPAPVPACQRWSMDASGNAVCEVDPGLFPAYLGPSTVRSGTGCVNIIRQPFPRGLVNVPMSFGLAHVFDRNRYSAVVPPPAYQYGWPNYQVINPVVPVGNNTVIRAYKLVGTDPDYRVWGGDANVATYTLWNADRAGDGYYPTVQRGYAWVEMYLDTLQSFDSGNASLGEKSPMVARWQASSRLDSRLTTNGGGFATAIYNISSFNGRGRGPDKTLANTLPAFRVRLGLPWRAAAVYAYWRWEIRDHQYVPVMLEHEAVSLSRPDEIISYRVSDPRLPSWQGNTCSQVNGWLSVPVLEAPTVLTR